MADASSGTTSAATDSKTAPTNAGMTAAELAVADAPPPSGVPRPTGYFLWIIIFLILSLVVLLILTFLSLRDPSFSNREPKPHARGCCRPTAVNRCGSAPCGCSATTVVPQQTATGAAAAAGNPLWPGRRSAPAPMQPIDPPSPHPPNELRPLVDEPVRA